MKKQTIKQTKVTIQSILLQYHDEQVIFNSSTDRHRFVIAKCDKDGVNVERLDAGEPQRVTFAQADEAISRVQSASSLEFMSLGDTSAFRNTILQAEPVALSANQKFIVFLADNPARLKNLLEVIDHLQMSNRLYKPSMILCVLEGISSGELPVNRISFDWIAPRFIAKMKELGKDVTDREAAMPFYHLTGDLIWLHAVSNRTDLMHEGGEGPNAARKKIKYALLKETYWNLLQDPASRLVARQKLEAMIMPKLSSARIHSTAEAALKETGIVHRPASGNCDLVHEAEVAIKSTGFVYTPDLLRRFISSLAAKPFLILTGNSGTGKTKLAQLIAHWMTGTADEKQNGYAIVPVGADWTDNRNVVGFVNHFRKDGRQNPIYQSTAVLDLLLRAGADLSRPYFLILDEMNLSHVERYFSDFLSAMESKKPIPLHQEMQDLETSAGITVKNVIGFPENLFVIGTVNVDETTYMFSPKVLDRANVLEFRINPKQAEDFLQSAGNQISPVIPNLGAALEFLNLSRRARGLTGPDLSQLEGTALSESQLSLLHLLGLLYQARLEFAFRTLTEVMRYLRLDFALTAQPSNWQWLQALDAQILQKILPKLHGSRRRLEAILVALANYCENRNFEKAEAFLKVNTDLSGYPPTTPPSAISFPLSYSKLLEMIEAVRRDQFASYIQ